MAEQITIAGKQYPKAVVYGGGLAVAGIVGYAWFTRSSSGIGEEDVVAEDVPDVRDTVDTGVLPFRGTESGTFTEGPVAYRNDQEWFNDALDKLLFDYGVVDTPTASAALNKYLSQTPMSDAEIGMINFVISSIGPPPSGVKQIRKAGTVTPVPPTNTTPAVAPLTGLKWIKVTPTTLSLGWNKVTGASKIVVTHEILSGTGKGTKGSKTLAGTTVSFTSTGAKPGSKHKFTVAGVSSSGKRGTSSTIIGTTPRK